MVNTAITHVITTLPDEYIGYCAKCNTIYQVPQFNATVMMPYGFSATENVAFVTDKVPDQIFFFPKSIIGAPHSVRMNCMKCGHELIVYKNYHTGLIQTLVHDCHMFVTVTDPTNKTMEVLLDPQTPDMFDHIWRLFEQHGIKVTDTLSPNKWRSKVLKFNESDSAATCIHEISVSVRYIQSILHDIATATDPKEITGNDRAIYSEIKAAEKAYPTIFHYMRKNSEHMINHAASVLMS